MAAIGNLGVRFALELDGLFDLASIELDEAGAPDLSRTPGTVAAAVAGSGGPPSNGAGRSSDKAFNDAVERRAVDMATAKMVAAGWSVRELGKPYDLVCRRPDGTEKHVEVKGTTGAGAEVTYTPNEVRHFRTCPDGADLIVVRDIRVDRTTSPYLASGGELLHIPSYAAPPEDLQATGWLGRVDGW